MNESPGIALDSSDGAILSVSSKPEVHARLERIVKGCGWDLLKNDTLASSFSTLESRTVSIVICEDDLFPGTWREMLKHIVQLDDPPLLIVTARLADERLWAEALNLGVQDVLATPFDATEVIRIVGIAQQRWRNVRELRPRRRRAAMAVGAIQ
jgi:DNA-binding response OmpR family regulator